jgi:ABC-type branched-subunit amino acid transport system ATPase component
MAAEAAQAAVARSALAILQHMDNIAKNWYNEVAFELDPASKSLNQHAKLLAGSKHAVLAHDKALLHASKFLPCGEELAGMPNDVAKRITDQVREFRRAASSKDVATMARTIGNGKEVADQFVKQIAGFRDTVQARVDQAVARYQREIDGLRSRWLCRPPV